MNTSAEYQLDFRHLKETEEGVEVYLFLQNLKNIYKLDEVVGTYICSKVKNFINNFRHKVKRSIYEELKVNKFVSPKLDNIVASTLKESNFEKLFEYYSGASFDKEFTESKSVCCKAIHNVNKISCENNITANYPSNQSDAIENYSSKLMKIEERANLGNKNAKRVFVEHLEDSYIIHLKTFNSINSLKNLLCQGMNLKKDALKNSTIKNYNKDSKQWLDVTSWDLIKQDDSLRIFHPEESKDVKPHIAIEDGFYDIDAQDPPPMADQGISTVQDLIDKYKRSGGNEGWVDDFRIPVLNSKLSKKMKEGKAISAAERIKICQTITDGVKKLHAALVTSKEVQFILQCLFLTYQKLLYSENDTWVTYNIWKVSLENMFEKYNSKMEQLPNLEVEPAPSPKVEVKSQPKTVNVKRKSQTSLSSAKKKKPVEMSPILPVNEELSNDDLGGGITERVSSAGMNATYQERRMQIVSENWGIEDIFCSYPWLYDENEIFAEFSRIVEKNFQVDNMIELGLRKITDPLLQILKTHQRYRAIVEKEKELKAVESKKTNNFNFKMALYALPLAIGEDVETIFKQSGSYYDEPIQIEYTGSEQYDNGKSYSVVIESSKIECSNLKKAVAVYFCSFFIFNLAYPSDIKKFLYAIERKILNIGGRTPPPVAVVKLFEKIEEFTGKDV